MSATRTDRPEPNADRIVRSPEPEQRFRANTVEEAIAQARDALGPDVEIVEANRIRRGGIGGFFATELGVEIVARGGGHRDRTDVFEPFTGAVPAAPAASAPVAEQRMTPASRPPAPRPWSVDQTAAPAARVVADPSMPAARARQAWRAAAHETAADAPADDVPADDVPGQLSMPGLDVPAEPTTFADHFLRELMQDAEQLRRTPDRNRVLPVREPAPTTAVAPVIAPADEPAPVRRRTASMIAAGATPGATEPLAEPQPLAGTPVSPPATELTDTPTLPGMPAPAPKRARAPRAKRSGTGTVRSTAERRAAEEAAAKAAEEAAAEAAAEVAAEAVAARVDGPQALIGDLIDHCVQLTSDADAGAEKIALAVTLPDGSVMKVSIERPRRTGRGAHGGA